ncbi:Alpha-1A adrenergic receptor [Orchesella cincta]|uniref:Alpha-1A adrenergic receptor n=1 Tax=Orchesella cincta TaxID=48709 RepID=A0A1D2MIF7_ORCCI|nr:Alpha-1A adrenergic receptor [Orchesella cincta]
MNSSEPQNDTSSSCDAEDVFSFLSCSPDALHLTGTVVKSIALSLIIIFTIFGNVLVLLAVALSRNLRSSTHYLIVNLAVADLLLGTTVLPFSAAFEITGRWYFGQTFCEIWAAVDVLCCTSSILSLCVISLDRYIGVTRPLAYSTIMVGRRTSALIVVIWTASFAISIGPLLGWREPPGDEPYYCTVNKQLGYVFFSATGSFYLPMLIILSVYWKIYKAAIRQTKFLESGQKTTKQDVTLRIHLGGTIGGYGLKIANRANSAPDLALLKVTPTRNGKTGKAKEAGAISSKYENSPYSHKTPYASKLVGSNINEFHCAPLARPEVSSASSHTDDGCGGLATVEGGTVLRAHRGGRGNKGLHAQSEYNCNWTCVSYTNGRQRNGNKQQETNGNSAKTANNKSPRPPEDFDVDHHQHHNHHHHHHIHNHHKNETKAREGGQPNSLTPSPPSSSPERKLNPGFGKIAKFRRQKKAAKTLAIVVGVFLGCWFPFFLVLPLGALCENCIPEWIFSVCFWLGYFNSCLNPVIYACTSREFQRAFRRILCRKTPARPHLSRAVYRANNLNTRFIERDYNGGAHLGNGTPPGIPMIPISHWR